VIVRTSWLYGPGGPNFVYTMLRLMKEKDSISVVADQQGSPTRARDLAQAIITIVTAEEPVYGIYHYSNAGTTSWYHFARAIQRIGREEGLLETECTIAPVATDQYPTRARRPAWSVLDKSKIISDYGVAVPQWEESLGRFLKGVRT
jgi:dTDP-4-dehydrorhamnose reductase